MAYYIVIGKHRLYRLYRLCPFCPMMGGKQMVGNYETLLREE
jgi:hypothetical protein